MTFAKCELNDSVRNGKKKRKRNKEREREREREIKLFHKYNRSEFGRVVDRAYRYMDTFSLSILPVVPVY